MIGESIGHYRITGELGAGGMGEVYRATDSKLGREVAIKVLPAAFSQDADRMARFQREAQVLASLNHPNIAAIYGIEERAIVMELVEGETLRGPLPLHTALNYAGQIADALEAAHEKGITHRDLKPANIKITPPGVVKVLDFGLAKIAEPTSGPGNPMTSPTLTMRASEAGMILGTAAYMAPEQARGQAVDKRADIWAFGVVLWEMLTGKRMFSGETVTDVLAGVLKSDPDLQAAPRQVQRLLARCLEKDPRKRLRDIGDWRDLLEEPPQSKPISTLPWGLAGLLTLGLALALWAPRRNAPDRPLVQLDLDVGDSVTQPAVSNDGQRIVFVSRNQLALRRLDQAKITTVAGTEGASFPFFSPDGQWIAFFADRKLQKVAVDGGALVMICDAPKGSGGAWGEDGNIIASLDTRQGLSRVSASGGTPQAITDVKGDERVIGHLWPQLLPGGKGVMFTELPTGPGAHTVQVMPLGGGKPRTLVENAAAGRYLTSGYLVYHQRATLLAAQLDLNRMKLTGPAIPVVGPVAADGNSGVEFGMSPLGTLVYRRSITAASFTVCWLSSSGKVEPLLAKQGGYWMPRLAPDGKRLALSMAQDGQRNIWIYDFTREAMSRLTFDSAAHNHPLWTPDGEFVAFASDNTLAWVRSDGSGKVERLLASRNSIPSSFSPDGKWMVFIKRDQRTNWDVWIVPVERRPGTMRLGQPQPLLQQEHQQTTTAISPDGRWLAYASDESGRFEVYVIPFSPLGPARNGKWLVSNEGGFYPVWSQTTGELLYLGADRHIMAATYRAKGDSFAVEKPRLWSGKQLADVNFRTFDLAPDGKRAVALVDPEDAKPETHLRVLLNVGDELKRRTGTK